MHVGLIVPSYSTDPSTQIPSLALLVDGLAEQIDVSVVPLRNPAGSPPHALGAVTVLDPGGAGLRLRALAQTTLTTIRKRHRKHPFDLLHAYWLFEPGLLAALTGRLLGIPVIASIGGAEVVSLPTIAYGGMSSARGRTLHRAVLGASRFITGGSSYVLDLARDAWPASAEKLRLAPLPVETDTAATPPANPFNDTAALHLLQVGAYLPVKGQDLSIRALKQLARRPCDLRMTMLGEDPRGYKRRMQALAQNLGVAQQVRLRGRIPHAELASYYHHSDLLLMPSRHESQGMVVLEAAAHGLATIGANVGVVRDLAPVAAMTFSAGDLHGLTEALEAALAQGEHRQLVASAARRAARDIYGMEPVVQRWLALYAETLHGD